MDEFRKYGGLELKKLPLICPRCGGTKFYVDMEKTMNNELESVTFPMVLRCQRCGTDTSYAMSISEVCHSQKQIGFSVYSEDAVLTAKAQDAAYMYAFGNNYWNGIDVNKCLERALLWWELAAECGNPRAQLQLCNYFYRLGERKSAYFWIFLSASQGNLPESQFLLGSMLYEGLGVEEDKVRALYFLQRAAERVSTGRRKCWGSTSLKNMIFGGQNTGWRNALPMETLLWRMIWQRSSSRRGNSIKQQCIF